MKNVAIPKFQEWGFTVDVIHSETDYLDIFFHVISKSRNGNNGKMRGFPLSGRCTINRYCKLKRDQDDVTMDKNFRPAYDPAMAQKRVQEALRRSGRKKGP